jgi:uncharacterized protein YcnI
MNAVLLAALIITAQAPKVTKLDEPEPQVYSVEYGELDVPSGDNGSTTHVAVGRGLFLNDPAAVAVALQLKGYKAENESLKKAVDEKPAPQSSWYLIGGALLLGVAGGFALSYTLGHH